MLRIGRRAWLLAVLSGILQILVFPLPNLYILSWVAIAPLLVAILSAQHPESLQFRGEERLLPASPPQAFLLGYVCGILWYAGTCYWVFTTMKQYGGIGPAGAFGLLLLFCLYLALYHGLFGLVIALLAKSSTRLALVLSPLAWVAVELARTRISGFPWDLLGTVQADNFALARISRFTGVYGVSFEIMVVNAAFAATLLLRRSRRNRLLLAAVAAAFVLQVSRWMPAPPLPADHTAVLVQENIPVLDSADWSQQYFDDTLAELTRTSLDLPQGERLRWHPELIVWPESPAPFYSGDPRFRTALSQLAASAQAWVVAGSIGVQNAAGARPQEFFNSAVLVSPGGELTARYDKIHLVPFGEYVPFKNWLSFAGGLTKEVGDFSRGVSRRPLQAGDERLGVFICYESIFPDEVRRFAENGAQVLVNISNDGWYGDSGAYAQHLKQARMRAIENSRWLLRSTNTGVTAAIDPFGRIAQSVPRKTRTALVASYALSNSTTFYTRHGDWFAYACAIILVIAIVVALTPGKGRRIG
jgi:apolipoprotein N-acyltransferase